MRDIQKPIAVVLSGGGGRATVHLGVWKALEELGIKPQQISGVSMGGIIGALWAHGYTADEALKIFEDNVWHKWLDVGLGELGLLSTKKIQRVFQQVLPSTFEELTIPLTISAFCLQDAEIYRFDKGDLVAPLLASMSVPVIFPPVRIGENDYVDSGILENLPVRAIPNKGDYYTIGVHANPLAEGYQASSFRSSIERYFQAVGVYFVRRDEPLCDLYIEPTPIAAFKFSNLNVRAAFDIGYRFTIEMYSNIEDD